MLDPKAIELLQGPNYAALTTLMPDGHPQTQIVWVDTDGEHVLVNTERHRQKARNVQRDPRVTVLVWDRNDMWHRAEIRGEVVEIVGGEEGREMIDRLSNKSLGHDYRIPIQPERGTPEIAPRRLLVQWAGTYWPQAVRAGPVTA